MSEARSFRESEMAQSIVARELLGYLTRVQTAPLGSGKKEEAVRLFEQTLDASRALFPRFTPEQFDVTIATMRGFIDLPYTDLPVEYLVKIGAFPQDGLDEKYKEELLTPRGITQEALDFLGKGLGDYSRE